jgi:hypothetical protein
MLTYLYADNSTVNKRLFHVERDCGIVENFVGK